MAARFPLANAIPAPETEASRPSIIPFPLLSLKILTLEISAGTVLVPVKVTLVKSAEAPGVTEKPAKVTLLLPVIIVDDGCEA